MKERLKKHFQYDEQNNINTENEKGNINEIKNQKNNDNSSDMQDKNISPKGKEMHINWVSKWLDEKINNEKNPKYKINIFENNNIFKHNIHKKKQHALTRHEYFNKKKSNESKYSFIRHSSTKHNSFDINEVYEKGKYNDNEMNLLSYKMAKKHDKRTYIEYYISLLKTKHLLIFSFFNSEDYNSRIIKIYIFFFTIQIEFTISAMFYSDETMHQIYEDKGSFNFEYQIPQMLYSSLLSSLLTNLISNLGLFEDNILNLKNCKYIKLGKHVKKETRCIKTKILFFFIITYILLFCFWVYVGCFCAVYKNTQIHLLIEVLSSFGLSFILPLIIYLIPGIFRIASLKGEEKRNNILLYKLSLIIQHLL